MSCARSPECKRRQAEAPALTCSSCVQQGSRFLQKWDCVVWLAMLHVAFTVPIRAAGFLDAHVPNDDLSCQVWQGILRGAALPDLLDLFVDAIFICDMFVSMHTAFYRSTGNGHRVLVEEVGEVRQRYLRSRALLYDICGVVPLRLSFCVLASLLPSSIRCQRPDPRPETPQSMAPNEP